MKRTLSLVIALVLVTSALSYALAADVSKYEAHATINLTPFKSDRYDGSFDDVAYEATIKSTKSINMKMQSSYASEDFTFTPRIRMKALHGIEVFSPELRFSTSNYKSVGGFYCVVGENRYLIGGVTDEISGSYSYSGSIKIGNELLSVLEEIATTSYTVRFAVAGRTSSVYTLSPADKQIIKDFVSDIKASGLSEQLFDDTTSVIIITQYN